MVMMATPVIPDSLTLMIGEVPVMLAAVTSIIATAIFVGRVSMTAVRVNGLIPALVLLRFIPAMMPLRLMMTAAMLCCIAAMTPALMRAVRTPVGATGVMP